MNYFQIARIVILVTFTFYLFLLMDFIYHIFERKIECYNKTILLFNNINKKLLIKISKSKLIMKPYIILQINSKMEKKFN